MQRTIYSNDPEDFPVKTAPHCLMCNFLRVCAAGKEWVAEHENRSYMSYRTYTMF
jgi:hypothetical protein